MGYSWFAAQDDPRFRANNAASASAFADVVRRRVLNKQPHSAFNGELIIAKRAGDAGPERVTEFRRAMKARRAVVVIYYSRNVSLYTRTKCNTLGRN